MLTRLEKFTASELWVHLTDCTHSFTILKFNQFYELLQYTVYHSDLYEYTATTWVLCLFPYSLSNVTLPCKHCEWVTCPTGGSSIPLTWKQVFRQVLKTVYTVKTLHVACRHAHVYKHPNQTHCFPQRRSGRLCPLIGKLLIMCGCGHDVDSLLSLVVAVYLQGNSHK